MDMGFPEADARRALSASNGDVNLALTSLLAP
jgi:NACalpha-BTF3-like transcription factor